MPVDLMIKPRETDLGSGMAVRRALSSAARQAVGPFIFFDHFGPLLHDDEGPTCENQGCDMNHMNTASCGSFLEGGRDARWKLVSTHGGGPWNPVR